MSWNGSIALTSGASWSGSQNLKTLVGGSNFSTITANKVSATYWTPYPGSTGMLISTNSLFGALNGQWFFRNLGASGYTPANTNLTTAFTQSFQSLGGVMEFAASASTLRMFGGDGIVIEGGNTNFTDTNVFGINELRADTAIFSTLFASTLSVNVIDYISTSVFSTITTSTLTANKIFADFGTLSSINASSINTGTLNTLTLSTGSLTTGTASLFGTLNMCNNNITNTSSINTNKLNTLTISTGSLTISTGTFSGSLNMCNNSISNVNTITATVGEFTFGTSAPNATFTGLTAGSANITSLTGGSSGTNGTFADLTVNNNAVFNNSITDFKRHTLSNVDTIHSGGSGINLSNITLRATNALLGYGGNVEFDANQGSLVAANSVVTLKAKNGNRGKIVLDAEPGYAGIQGEINLTATGGTPPSATSLGGRIHLAATTPNPLTTVSPSYVLQTADSILAYAGALTPISGNYGYNYQQGLNGVNIVAGTVASIPNVPGTVYIYGTNLAGTGNSGGVRITNGLSVDVIYPYPTGFITQAYDLILKGNAAGNKVTLSNVRQIAGDSASLSGFTSLSATDITATTLSATSFSTVQKGFISSLTVNELLGIVTDFGTISTFSTLTSQRGFISSLSVSEITGITFPATVSSFSSLTSQTAFISSLTVNDIVFLRLREDFSILNVSSLFASTLSSGNAFINSAGFDSISTNKISTGTVSTGSLFANNAIINNLITISSITTVNISTINIVTANLYTSSISTNNFFANEATIQQLNLSNITLLNTPSFSIEQALISTTVDGYSAISSVKNLVLSTAIQFTAGTQEIQPFIPQYTVNTSNVGQWASTIFRLISSREGTQNFLGNLTPFTGGQVNYSNAPTSGRTINLTNQAGGGLFTVPVGCNYQYTWNGSAWSENRNPSPGSTTFGTSFSLFQTVNNTTLQTPDTLTLEAGNIVFAGAVSLSNLVATEANFQSTTTSNLTTTTLFGSSGTITTLGTTTLGTTTLGTSNMTYSNLVGTQTIGNVGITQTANYTTPGQTVNYIDNLLNFQAYPNVSSLTNQIQISTTINYNVYPGPLFTLIPAHSTSIATTILNSNGTITCPAFPNSNPWNSSIMTYYGQGAGNPADSIQLPLGRPCEFVLFAPVSTNYEMIISGLGYPFSIPPNNYHKWTNLTGSAWSSNLGGIGLGPYPTLPQSDVFSIAQQPGGVVSINSESVAFNYLPVIKYSNSISGNIAAGGPGGVYGIAEVTGIPIQFEGRRVKASDYIVTVSISGYFCAQASLAVTLVNATVYTGADGFMYITLRLDTATAAGTTSCSWFYDVLCLPKTLCPGGRNTESFTEVKGPWVAPIYPVLQLSSIIASTISMEATENIIFGAGVGIPTVLGSQGISLTANSNIGIVANNDVGITSFNMYLTATSSIQLSNAPGTAFMGLDENGTTALFGSNVVLFANNDALINSSNVIAIESLSTINITSYNYYQAASNLTELHNENFYNTSRTSANHITPDFRVSTCLNSYYIKDVRQPFVQYGDITGSSNTGNTQVVLPVPYSSINAYKAFVTMEDSEPAEMSCVRNSASTFTIYWQQAASGTHTIAWNTMGNVECGGGGAPPPPPAESAAYDLVNTIIGDTGDFSWTQDSTPDLETVYVLQSADDTSYSTYTTADVYTPFASFYSLPQGYWYKFYVSSHYPGSVRVDSSNSTSDYVNYA